jgi:mRNA-degrading endonuclease YafQ of YafQ-DinJ toxin-antitoxin module
VLVIESRRFRHAVKRLHANQKQELDEAIRAVVKDVLIGKEKTGDLAGVRVHKFHMLNQLTLVAYGFDAQNDTLNLIDLGSHENFYRDLKGQ